MILLCIPSCLLPAAAENQEELRASASSDHDDRVEYPTCTFPAFLAVVLDMLRFISGGRIQASERSLGAWLKLKQAEEDKQKGKTPDKVYKDGIHVQQLVDLINKNPYYFETSNKDLSFSMRINSRHIATFRELVSIIKPLEQTSHGMFVAQAVVALKSNTGDPDCHTVAAFQVSYDPIDGATVYGKNSWGGSQRVIAVRSHNFDYGLVLTPVVTDRTEDNKNAGPLPISDGYHNIALQPLVDSILESGPSIRDLKLSYQQANTLAIRAAQRNDLQALTVLAALGVDFGVAIDRAAQKDDIPTLKTLFAAGVKLDYYRLDRAVTDGRAGLVKALIEARADLDMKRADGHSVVTIAAIRGHLEVLELLIEAREDVNHATSIGETAVMIATKYNHAGVLSLLIKADAKLDVVSANGNNAVSLGAYHGPRPAEVLKVLIASRARLDQATNRAVTVAANRGHAAVLKFLIEANANLDQATDTGDTCTTLAAHHGHHEVLSVLIGLRADLDHVNAEGHTAWSRAEAAGHARTLDMLHSAGIGLSPESSDPFVNARTAEL